MIEIRCRDFRGLERADISVSPIALCAAPNASGKTSLCQAVAAALTGKTLPIAGMTKRDAGMLVRLGAGGASVEIRNEAGRARVAWPGCEASADGEPPHASEAAAGLASTADARPEERARALSVLLKSDPTREDFAAAMVDAGFGGDQTVASAWMLIEEKGWDGAGALRKDKGAELKGRWRQIAGQNYGSRIAAAWAPEGWSDDLDDTTDRELEGTVADAKAALKRAIAAEAATGARREVLADAAGKIDEHGRAVEGAAKELTAVSEEAATLRAERDALPASDGKPTPTVPCPCCGEQLIVIKTLTEAVALERAPAAPAPADQAELKRVRLRRATLDGRIAAVERRSIDAKNKLNAAQVALEISRNAKAELDALPPENGAAGGAGAAGAEMAVARAERRLAAWRAKTEADEIRERIAANEKLMEILAPDGLRARKLGRVLDLFNGRLASLCDSAGWKPVAVGPDMAISYGGRVFALLSASEQYRVRAVLQTATAQIDGSTMLVLDAADVLDAPTRSGLFGMLADAAIPALVALTMSKREQVPDLAAAGLGGSWWVEAGIAEPIGGAAEREAA